MNKEQIIALSKSAKKHIRNEKARIRHEFLDMDEREKQILKVYHKFIHEVVSEQKEKQPKVNKPAVKAQEENKVKTPRASTKIVKPKKQAVNSKKEQKTTEE